MSAAADLGGDIRLDTGLPAPHALRDWGIVALALLASVALVWLVTREPLITAIFAGSLVAIGAIGTALALRRAPVATADLAEPDWSVTVAAIERPDMAVAITDRAGRLVCANAVFERSFGIGAAPPRLPLADAALERLALATRNAWRDGRAHAERLEGPDRLAAADERPGDQVSWRCDIARAGRGEDFLIWRLSAAAEADPVTALHAAVEGRFGRLLTQAGLAAALVDPAGTILTANAGFIERALGDLELGPDLDTARATPGIAGADFFSLIRRDGSDHICWAHDGDGFSGGHGGALTVFHVPLAEGDAPAAAAPALMLVAEANTGIGADREARAAFPHLEALLQQLPHGLAMTDRDGRLMFTNAAFVRAAGREGREPPVFPTDLVVREDKAALSEAVRRYSRGPLGAGDIAVRLAAQPDDPVQLTLAGVRGLGDAAVLLGLTDTTEETRLKRQVAQATKMQAVGQLAGGVAHDFNNVLTAILGTCDLMLMRHTPGDSDYDDIQQIRANSNRAASLTRQLLAFSRQQTLRPQVLQLPDVVADTAQMLKRLIGEKIEFVVQHDRDLLPVRADPGQLGQVIMNLVVNARDAIHARGNGRGRIQVSTGRVDADALRDSRRAIVPAGAYTGLIVEDDGGGISPENITKIFEPFFTTKEQGRGGTMGGTGLGLSTVYGFVKQSGGFVFADSDVGRGTRFTVLFPADREGTAAPVAAPVPAPPPRAWGSDGRILLVEDEEPVRLVAERALIREGYKVTGAADGEEGLERMRAAIALGRGDWQRWRRLRPGRQRCGHAGDGRAGDGARAAPPRPDAARAVHLRLCRGAAAPRDRPAQRALPRQAVLGRADIGARARGAGRHSVAVRTITPPAGNAGVFRALPWDSDVPRSFEVSIIDKAVAAITPPESDKARAEATEKARAVARPGDWLSQVLDHHRQIKAQFEAVGAARGTARQAEQRKLGLLLTGHSIAEEVVLYPAMAGEHQAGHAELAYQEQSAAKMELGLLETLDPDSEDYDDKLEHIRGAVLHHIYTEEGTWFVKLAEDADAAEQARLTSRYEEEYARYMGQDLELA